MKIKIHRNPDNPEDIFVVDIEKEGIHKIKSGIVPRHGEGKVEVKIKKFNAEYHKNWRKNNPEKSKAIKQRYEIKRKKLKKKKHELKKQEKEGMFF